MNCFLQAAALFKDEVFAEPCQTRVRFVVVGDGALRNNLSSKLSRWA